MHGFNIKDQEQWEQMHQPRGLFPKRGPVVGPGTSTSDSVRTDLPEGSFVMPADSTDKMGHENLVAMGVEPPRGLPPENRPPPPPVEIPGVAMPRGLFPKPRAPAPELPEHLRPRGLFPRKNVPVALSNGEHVLSPEQVHGVGVKALEQMKDQTHVPRGLGKPPKPAEEPRLGFNAERFERFVQQKKEPQQFFAHGGRVGGFPGRWIPDEPRQQLASGGVVDENERSNQGLTTPTTQRDYRQGLARQQQAETAQSRAAWGADYSANGAQSAAEARAAMLPRQRNASVRPFRPEVEAQTNPRVTSTPPPAYNATGAGPTRTAAAQQTGLAGRVNTESQGLLGVSGLSTAGRYANPSLNTVASPELAQPTPPAPRQSQGNSPVAYEADSRTGKTNAQVAADNPQGRVQMVRKPDGSMAFSGTDVSGPVSYTGADGQALPGAGIRGSGFGRVDTVAASAMGSARGLPSAYQQVKAAQDAAAARGDIDALQRVGAVSGGVPQTAMASGGRRTPAAFGFDPENRNAQAARKRVLDSLSNDSSLTRSQRAALAEVYRTQVGAESQTERLGAEARTADADRLARSQQSAAEISAENMRESGRSAINSRELALKEGEATDAGRLRDLEIGQAQRRASILARYDSAAPEERQSLVQQYPDVFGRADGSDWRVQVTPQTKNQDGSTTEGSVIRYNQRTGQVERVEGGGGQQAVAQLPARVGERQIGTIYAMPNGQAARWTSDGWELT